MGRSITAVGSPNTIFVCCGVALLLKGLTARLRSTFRIRGRDDKETDPALALRE
jgi:hypothetical protein